jgi:hypothetical protein
MSGLGEDRRDVILRDSPPTDLISIIATAVADPRMDVEKMSRLLDMQERIVADQRKIAFTAAMSRLQGHLPQITKEGRILVKGTERSRYARLEDIDEAIRPLLAEEGFAFSFDSESTEDGRHLKISAKLSHREGYCETKTVMLPIDSSDFRTPVQSVFSTISYGKRQLIKMHLNIVERGEDIDGHKLERITDEQRKDIEIGLQDTESNVARFLAHFKAEKFEELLQRDYAAAMQMIETKRRGMEKKKAAADKETTHEDT